MTSSSAFSNNSVFVSNSSSTSFANRSEAGQVLATLIPESLMGVNPLILALPRGGVPVAYEISRVLQVPMDIFLVRRFVLPEHPDRTAGTVASGGIYNLEIDHLPASFDLESTLIREHAELARREVSYRQTRPAEPIRDRCVIVVDDGLTTGLTMRFAIHALRLLKPVHIAAAIPVASADVCSHLATVADSVICARTPAAFSSVRRCYADFAPILDGEIRQMLLQQGSQAASRAFSA